MSDQHGLLLSLTAQIVTAHITRGALSPADQPAFIKSTYESLYKLDTPKQPTPEPAALVPAVNPKKSVHDDFIICLEDGKKFKSLKRHLSTSYGMTPEQYRAKWGLPENYPMVAPNYASARSELAKKMGLGRGRASVN